MTKMTIATDARGRLIGAVQHGGGTGQGEAKTSVSFGSGARLHTVDVHPEIDMAKAKDAGIFHEALKAQLRKIAKPK
ncbi:MAG: hypothetical protein QOE79_40 [Sphingomonadales bacterium]|jgi:hypothetical protein|nr:hypothetical protein [Sphingomonadales bacterium]MEA3048216.1 hypothetical protein [Sphingomonadales bacterium]